MHTARTDFHRRRRKRGLLSNLFVLSLATAFAHTKSKVALASKTEPIHPSSSITGTSIHSSNRYPRNAVSAEDAASKHLLADLEDSKTAPSTEAEVLVVMTVDGTIAGLAGDTGELLWKHTPGGSRTAPHHRTSLQPEKLDSLEERKGFPFSASGFPRPLLSTTTTTQSAASSDFAAVPSIDGNVFLTSHHFKNAENSADPSQPAMTVSTSVKELVQRAPFLDTQGRFYMGQRHTSAAALDRQTGEILTVVSPDEYSGNFELTSENRLKGRDVVWIGRVDYGVTVQDARTGLRDVHFHVGEAMSLMDMQARQKASTDEKKISNSSTIKRTIDSETPSMPWDRQSHHGDISSREDVDGDHSSVGVVTTDAKTWTRTQEMSVSTKRIVSTPSGNLGMLAEGSSKLEWVAREQFDTPIAFAIEASTGLRVEVAIIPDVTVPSSDDLEYMSCELERQLDLIERDSHEGFNGEGPTSGDQTIVGRFKDSGQLFALPLGNKSKRESATSFHSTKNPNAAKLASTASSRHKDVPQLGGKRNIKALSQNLQLQDRANTAPRSCHPGSPEFPSCLVDHHKNYPPRLQYFARGKNNGFVSEGLPPFYSSDGQSTSTGDSSYGLAATQAKSLHESQQEPLKGLLYHPEYGYVDFNSFPIPHQHRSDTKSRSPYSSAIAILASWLPPTIVLIFVVSFELGRRKRLRDEAKSSETTQSNKGGESLFGGILNYLSSIRETNNEGQISPHIDLPAKQQQLHKAVFLQQRHVIQVSDQVLGFGGQGTVVYQGTLDGREVAVKRMLKAYHASADREIRLLIESDGHPNVVRYFLKEIRGDFVYLALELCDLSLHDLITVLRNNEMSGRLDAVPVSATKAVLRQICCGVKHLHSLRIVHRDLKPANILLAVAKRGRPQPTKDEDDIIAAFSEGAYVAKISDMGLGKQITGQSSLGASMIANSSLQGTKGCASSIGVGPGSVGWQAPEVMAVRWAASDSSGKSREMNQGTDLSLNDRVLTSARISRSVDIFSLGCVFYSTLVPGHHPFGEWYEREANIMHNRPMIDSLESSAPEAFDLVKAMITRDPKLRPTAKEICEHPFFWSSQLKLSFLCEFSDRLETDTVLSPSCQVIDILAIERGAQRVVGTSWDHKLDAPLISNVQKFRTYDSSSLRDLLRLIRNKHHHFDELPESFRREKMPNQDALLEYFERRFPRLLMHCWNCCRVVLEAEDPLMKKYSIPASPQSASSQVVAQLPKAVVVDSINDREKSQKEDHQRFSQPVQSMDSDLGFEILDQPPFADEQAEGLAEKIAENSISFKAVNIIAWEGSTAAKELNCRGWSRSENMWSQRIDPLFRRKDPVLRRATVDQKFRTRLCNHWDVSLGMKCPMRRKNKCVFAHGPVELRVKEGKKNRWGRLVDKNGDNKNPCHSGGEDTYGAARSIETARKEEGKWNTGKFSQKNKTQLKGGIKKVSKP